VGKREIPRELLERFASGRQSAAGKDGPLLACILTQFRADI